MKKIFILASLFGLGVMLSSCELDKFPETGYNEGNVETPEGEESTENENAITKKEDLAGLRTAMYDYLRDGFQDANYKHLTANACRADDAYGAGDSGKPTEVEANTFTSDNEFPSTFWTGFMSGVSSANAVICNLDAVLANDPGLTQAEYNQWMAEALCVRAYMWLLMTQYFGDIPMLTAIPPAINADNVEEVYPLYFPQRVDAETLKVQLEKDLAFACEHAPDPMSVERDFASKGFAQYLVARMYSLKQYRDWNKVKAACEAIEGMGYDLAANYADLWAFDLDAQTAEHNNTESIFEAGKDNTANGNWFFMMFWRNHFKPEDSFSWIKWCTPTRNLAEAYDAEGDTERKNISIRWDKCDWEQYYPKDNYAFMGKIPTNITVIYHARLADVLLLHAEALANLGDAKGAMALVNRVRDRAKIAALPENVTPDDAKLYVLNERRLELAYEGHRYFDLMRFGDDYSMLKEVHDGGNIKGSAYYDEWFATRVPLNDQRVLMPIPTAVLDENPNIEQNPGY